MNTLKNYLKQFDQQFKPKLVCGIDEVGRGPLAGPVVAACVHIPDEHINQPIWDQINDSKKLSSKKREQLFDPIKKHSIFGIAEANVEKIDRLNIHHATLLAMKRAYENMIEQSSFPRKRESSFNNMDPRFRENNIKVQDNILALIDGKFAPVLPCKTQTVIKGDATSLSIAAASILAKVTRDRMMANLHEEFSQYSWDRNAGYGTKAHMEGLNKYGLTPHHRLSFAPCKAIYQKNKVII